MSTTEDLDFLPFDMMGVKPKNGFDPYPAGIYLLEVKSSEQKTPASGKMFRNYKSEILMGPGWSQEYSGKPMSDIISVTEEDKGRHADLFQAAFGGEEAYNQLVMQNQGRLSVGMLVGRRYIAQITVSKDGARNFIGRRIPYSDENWKSNAGEMAQQVGGLMQPVAAAPMAAPQQFQQAPPQYQQAPQQFQQAYNQAPPMMQQPPMQQFQAPAQMQQPAQQFQAPPAPPAAGAPQWPAPPTMQQGASAYPAPPPPPGVPTGGSQQ